MHIKVSWSRLSQGEPTIANEQDDEIESILKKFPFHGRDSDRQITVLSSYLVEAPGNNKSETAEKLDVNRNTVNKIEKSWNSLSSAEKLKLIDFLRREFADRHFADPEAVSADPGTEGQMA
jgi:hypothetical protein